MPITPRQGHIALPLGKISRSLEHIAPVRAYCNAVILSVVEESHTSKQGIRDSSLRLRSIQNDKTGHLQHLLYALPHRPSFLPSPLGKDTTCPTPCRPLEAIPLLGEMSVRTKGFASPLKEKGDRLRWMRCFKIPPHRSKMKTIPFASALYTHTRKKKIVISPSRPAFSSYPASPFPAKHGYTQTQAAPFPAVPPPHEAAQNNP